MQTLIRADTAQLHWMKCTQRWVSEEPSNCEGVLRPQGFPELEPSTIQYKNKSIELYTSGVFGNALPQWDKVSAIRAAGYDGLVMVRCRKPSGRCSPNVRIEDAEAERNTNAHLDLLPRSQYYYSEQLPNQSTHLVIQGELIETPGQLYLRWSMQKGFMRDSLREDSRHDWLPVSRRLINFHACHNGRRTIFELLELYPGHVIEFTVMDIPFGDLGWHTIIWEVRNY